MMSLSTYLNSRDQKNYFMEYLLERETSGPETQHLLGKHKVMSLIHGTKRERETDIDSERERERELDHFSMIGRLLRWAPSDPYLSIISSTLEYTLEFVTCF